MNRFIAAALTFAIAASAQVPDRAELQNRLKKTISKTVESFVFFQGGSGCIISEDGEVLTNHHVAGSGPNTVEVYLSNNQSMKAERIGTDPTGDLCLYKLKPNKEMKFKPIPFADSDKIEVGQVAIAIGNPFNQGYESSGDVMYPAYSVGIVSAVHRNQGTYFDTIQTDAAVNPGNSGGPLITLDGRLIGINGRIATRYNNRVNSGVGYAISTAEIKHVLPALRAGKKVVHGALWGVQVTSAKNGMVRIINCAATSKAYKAGLRKEDLVASVDGVPVPTPERFVGMCGRALKGDKVKLKVYREGEEMEVVVELDGYKDEIDSSVGKGPKEAPPGAAWLGIRMKDGTSDEGVEILEVINDSPAEHAGLKPGDVLLEVNDKKVTNADEVRELIWQHKPGDKVTLTIVRGTEDLKIDVTLGERTDK